MGEVVVWWVRLVFAIILIGALSLAVAFLLSIGGIGADLRRFLGGVALWSFYSLLLLVPAMLVLSVGNKISQRLRNWLHRRDRGKQDAAEFGQAVGSRLAGEKPDRAL